MGRPGRLSRCWDCHLTVRDFEEMNHKEAFERAIEHLRHLVKTRDPNRKWSLYDYQVAEIIEIAFR